MYIDWCNTFDEYSKCLYNRILNSDVIVTDKQHFSVIILNLNSLPYLVTTSTLAAYSLNHSLA